MSLVELALVIILLIFVFRGGVRSAHPLWLPSKRIARDGPIRLTLLVILILLLIGFLVKLLLPLGEEGALHENHSVSEPLSL